MLNHSLQERLSKKKHAVHATHLLLSDKILQSLLAQVLVYLATGKLYHAMPLSVGQNPLYLITGSLELIFANGLPLMRAAHVALAAIHGSFLAEIS